MKQLESEIELCRRIMKSWEKLRLLYNGGPPLSRYRPALENPSPAGGSDGPKSS